MPFPNQHAARLTDPDKYSDFRTFIPEGFPAGIQVILGIKDDKSEFQAIRADKAKWSVAKFKDWLAQNNFDPILFEPAMHSNSKAAKSLTRYFSTWTELDLVKGEQSDSSSGEEARAYVEGIISSDSVDQQGDIIKQEGLDFSYFLKRGWLNDDHRPGAANVVGQPLNIYKTKLSDGTPATAMKAYLFLNKPRAKEIYETAVALKSAKSDRRLGFSIEGEVLQRDPVNKNVILKARVLHVAVTNAPCNTDASNMELVERSMRWLRASEEEVDAMTMEIAARLLRENPELARMEVMQAIHQLTGSPGEQQEDGEQQEEGEQQDDSVDTLDAEEEELEESKGYKEQESKAYMKEYEEEDISAAMAEVDDDSMSEDLMEQEVMQREAETPVSNASTLVKLVMDKLKGDLAVLMAQSLDDMLSEGASYSADKPNISSSQLARLLMQSFPHLSETQAKKLAINIVNTAKGRV